MRATAHSVPRRRPAGGLERGRPDKPGYFLLFLLPPLFVVFFAAFLPPFFFFVGIVFALRKHCWWCGRGRAQPQTRTIESAIEGVKEPSAPGSASAHL